MRLINLYNLLGLKTPGKKEKILTFAKAESLFNVRQKVINGFEIKIFPTGKQSQGKGIKTLTTKQMLKNYQ